MNILDAIKNRKSIRKYKNEPLPDGALYTILESARLANSARNRQEWAFVVVSNDDVKQNLVPACYNQAFVADASVVIVACATNEYTMRCGQPAHVIDTAIAIDHMQLAAESLGLGSCWLGSFFPDQVSEILDIPDDIAIIGVLPIGVPAESGRDKTRKPLDEIVHYEKWSAK